MNNIELFEEKLPQPRVNPLIAKNNKNRQRLLIVVTGLCFVAAILISVSTFTKKPPTPQQTVERARNINQTLYAPRR